MSHKSNAEFVTELMEFSRVGSLAQMFILDAIFKQACVVATASLKNVRSGAVHPEAWRAAAREVASRMAKQYGWKAESPIVQRDVARGVYSDDVLLSPIQVIVPLNPVEGYSLGTCLTHRSGCVTQSSRDSVESWPSRELAQAALDGFAWTQTTEE